MGTHRSELKWRIPTVFAVTTLLVATVDHLTKIWIRLNLPLGQSLLVHGFFRITHVRNTGATFGLFHDQTFLLTIVVAAVTVFLLVFVIFFLWRFPFLDNMSGRFALGLIFGGAISNLIDRLVFGYVTDFINIGIWPAVFNIADSAIHISSIMAVYFLLSHGVAIKRQSDPVLQ